MHSIAQSDDLAIRQCWSQHGLDNAFQHVTMADPDRGIFGATPVETLHAFRKGLVEMVTHVVIDNVHPSKKQHWTALHCIFTKLTGKASAVHSHPQLFAMG
jgi:hypothetical protein